MIHVAVNATYLIDELKEDLIVLEGDAAQAWQRTAAKDSVVGAYLNLGELIAEYDPRMRGVLLATKTGDDVPHVREWDVSFRSRTPHPP